MKRRSESAGNRADKTDFLGYACQCCQQSQRVKIAAWSVRNIINRMPVGEENRIKFAALGNLRQIGVIADITELLDRRLPMPSCGTVMSATEDKQIEVHFPHQFFTKPPSTTRFCPVTERAHGEAKNSAVSANSEGVVTRRNGVAEAI